MCSVPATEGTDTLVQEYHHNPADYNSDDNSEDDEMFGSYHQYRAMLDREEEENRHDDDEEDGSNVETITPRRINDVSGMLRQFAQHPGTLPPIFPPSQEMAAGDNILQTWPNLGQHNVQGVGQQENKGEEEEEEHKQEDEEVEAEQLPTDVIETVDIVHDRNSFIDSWLEESVDHGQDSMAHTHQQPFHLTQGSQVTAASTMQHLDLDLPETESADSEAETPRAHGAPETESERSKERGERHLLSNVELIDTLTSVNSAAKSKRGRQRRVDSLSQGSWEEGREEDVPPLVNGLGQPGVAPNPHLLSNVELYSTVSTYHPASRPPRHLLSNVELASTASGSSHPPDTASSRPSRQSSANSAGRRHELEACVEIENSKDEAQLEAPQPPDDVSHFFAAPQQPERVNGVYDSSDEELDYQYSGARAAAPARVRAVSKGNEPCQSVTGMTEDSGLESGAKSSQDEREALSLLDSTQGHGLSGAATVPEFFLPTEQLQASMRALQLATSAAAAQAEQSQVCC